MNGFHKLTTRGFTLIETMIAVAILSLAVAGPLYAANRAIVAAQVARDQLVALYLAQEGIEYVRAMRDDAYLAAYREGGTQVSATAWDAFLHGTGATSISGCVLTTCTIDPARTMGTGVGLALEPCEGESCGMLYLANERYTVQNDVPDGVPTAFTRTVQATEISANEERIESVVSWSFHGTPYLVKASDHLTPWQ